MRIYLVTFPMEEDAPTFHRLRKMRQKNLLVSYYFLLTGRNKPDLSQYERGGKSEN